MKMKFLKVLELHDLILYINVLFSGFVYKCVIFLLKYLSS